jgi:hypothetical protein
MATPPPTTMRSKRSSKKYLPSENEYGLPGGTLNPCPLEVRRTGDLIHLHHGQRAQVAVRPQT